MKKILLIGCGHMGNALLVSWIKSNQYSLTVVDPIKYKSLRLKYKRKNNKFIESISELGKIINFKQNTLFGEISL